MKYIYVIFEIKLLVISVLISPAPCVPIIWNKALPVSVPISILEQPPKSFSSVQVV